MVFTDDQIRKRNSFVQQYRNVYGEMRAIDNRINELLQDPDSNVEMLEKQYDLLHRQLEPIICDYWHWLPPMLLSRCPFCHEDLRLKFDPVDFNGFWWMDRTERTANQQPTCPHFVLLTGAVDRKGIKHDDTLFSIIPGPEKPFVIPQILEKPGMKAVLTDVTMNCGFTAHPIVYFVEDPPEQLRIDQHWGSKSFYYQPDPIVAEVRIKEEDFDFELGPWLDKGKLITENLGE